MKAGDEVWLPTMTGRERCTIMHESRFKGAYRVRLGNGRGRTVLAAKLTPCERPAPVPQSIQPGAIPVAASTERLPIRSIPKSPPVRDKGYMAFVRTHPCCSCGADQSIEAHHYGPAGTKGMGLKTDDLRCVPLCTQCHREFHAHGVCRAIDNADDQQKIFNERQISLLIKWKSAA